MLSTNEKSLQSQVKDVEEMAQTLSEIKKENRRDLLNFMEGFRLDWNQRSVQCERG